MLSAFVILRLVAAQSGSLLTFEWVAPPACPPTESLRARLGDLSGRAVATVTEQPSGWKLELRVNESVRELTTRTCEEAADAAVLIIQLGLTRRDGVDATPAPASAPVVVAAPEEPFWTMRASLIGGAGLVTWPQALARLGAAASLHHGRYAATLDVTTELRGHVPRRR